MLIASCYIYSGVLVHRVETSLSPQQRSKSVFPPRTRLHNQTPAKGEPGSEGDDDGDDGNGDGDDGNGDDDGDGGDDDDDDNDETQSHPCKR